MSDSELKKISRTLDLIKDSTEVQTQDYVYYNIKFENQYQDDETYATKKLIYAETKSEPLIDGNTAAWEMAIARFNISSKSVPLYEWPTKPYDPPSPKPPDYDDYAYKLSPFIFTLSYDGNDSSDYVRLTRTNFDTTPPAIPAVGEKFAFASIYYIYEVMPIINSLNDSLVRAFNALAAKPIGSTAPYFVYEPENELIYLCCDKSHYLSSLAKPIEIWVNKYLFTQLLDPYFIEFYPNNPTTHKEVKFVIQDTVEYYHPDTTNRANYLKIPQDFRSIHNIASFTDLIIKTNLIPVRKEESNSINLRDNSIPPTASRSGILTDFNLTLTQLSDVRSSSYQYSPSEFRWITMNNATDLRNMDFQVFIKTRNGIERELRLDPDSQSSIKVILRRKENVL